MAEKFLIVDDSENTRELLVAYLSETDYEVDSTEDVQSVSGLFKTIYQG